MVNVTMSITIMFVILMVVIAAIKFGIIMLEIIDAASFITLKCAIMTKGIVVTTLEFLMGSVMTQTITEFAIMMEETAALDLRILTDALCVFALMSLM